MATADEVRALARKVAGEIEFERPSPPARVARPASRPGLWKRLLGAGTVQAPAAPSPAPLPSLPRKLWSKDVARNPTGREWEDRIVAWRLALAPDGELLFGTGGRQQGGEDSFSDQVATDEQLRYPDATWRHEERPGRVDDRMVTFTQEHPVLANDSYAGLVALLEGLRT